MFDLFRGVAGGPRNWILGWALPAIVVSSAVGYFLIPHFPEAPLPSRSSDRALVLIGATLVVALLLSALSTSMYRFLEGYAWPQWFQKVRIRAHQERQARLRSGASRVARVGEPISAIATAQKLERLYQYPVDPTQIAPTYFGNAIRAFETYGYDRFQLDSQTMWNELISVVPDSLRQEEVDSRTPVNFFVSFIWLDVVYVVLVFATGLTQGWDGGLVASLIIGLVLVALSYCGAIRSCAGWGQAVRAVVNLGRRPLAIGLGLQVPQTIEEEREMWRALGWFVADNFELETASDLDRWRIAPYRGPVVGQRVSRRPWQKS